MLLIALIYLFVYLLSCFAVYGIFRKAGEPIIYAFIPVFNLIRWLQINHRSAWWILLSLWWVTLLFMMAMLAADTLRRFHQHRFIRQLSAAMFGVIYYPALG